MQKTERTHLKNGKNANGYGSQPLRRTHTHVGVQTHSSTHTHTHALFTNSFPFEHTNKEMNQKEEQTENACVLFHQSLFSLEITVLFTLKYPVKVTNGRGEDQAIVEQENKVLRFYYSIFYLFICFPSSFSLLFLNSNNIYFL